MIDRDDINGVAAEYVLGTLDAAERTEVAIMRAKDAVLDAAIIDFENKLAPLNDIIPPAVPSPGLFALIEQRLFASHASIPPQAANDDRPYWRAVALAASLALVITLGFAIKPTPEKPQWVAVLQKDATTPLFVVSFNEKTATLNIHTLAQTVPADKDYELWLIADGDKTPHSLGVLPKGDGRLKPHMALTSEVISQATLAVSLEPAGGSPTGAPTGPVIVVGKVVKALL